MRTLQDLGRRCKGDVTVHINPHYGDYQTIKEYLDERRGLESGLYKDAEEPKEGDSLYELQFYPRTPISFYFLVGFSLDDLVAEAHRLLDEEPQ